MTLRSCWLTVAYVPQPAAVLRRSFGRPLDLTQTFYGTDPLAGVWAIACARATVAGKRAGRTVLSLVAAPTGLTSPKAPPLANFFSHALLRVDTTSRALARVLDRAGLPVRLSSGVRYRHSSAGSLPFAARLAVPGRYRVAVRASTPDPTNPHDHANRFVYQRRGRSPVRVGLAARAATDRFCFPASGGCSAPPWPRAATHV